MSMTDPIADLLTRIRNASQEKHASVEVPASRIKASIVRVLKEEGYIKIIETGDESLIGDLEKFIELRDNIKAVEAMKNEYTDIINKLKRLSDYNDEAAVNGIIEEYLRR